MKNSLTLMPKRLVHLLFIFLFSLTFFTSCYSVRFQSKDGVFEVDPRNNSEGFYNQKKTHVIDTVIRKAGPFNDAWIEPNTCYDCGFYSIEYRVNFGMVLRNFFTFGRQRRVKVTIVCVEKD